jgi:hypothetical protein
MLSLISNCSFIIKLNSQLELALCHKALPVCGREHLLVFKDETFNQQICSLKYLARVQLVLALAAVQGGTLFSLPKTST